MQRLAPDVIVLYAEPGNGGHVIAQQALLLLEGQARNQVRRALLEGIRRVEINRKPVHLGQGRNGQEKRHHSGEEAFTD